MNRGRANDRKNRSYVSYPSKKKKDVSPTKANMPSFWQFLTRAAKSTASSFFRSSTPTTSPKPLTPPSSSQILPTTDGTTLRNQSTTKHENGWLMTSALGITHVAVKLVDHIHSRIVIVREHGFHSILNESIQENMKLPFLQRVSRHQQQVGMGLSSPMVFSQALRPSLVTRSLFSSQQEPLKTPLFVHNTHKRPFSTANDGKADDAEPKEDGDEEEGEKKAEEPEAPVVEETLRERDERIQREFLAGIKAGEEEEIRKRYGDVPKDWFVKQFHRRIIRFGRYWSKHTNNHESEVYSDLYHRYANREGTEPVPPSEPRPHQVYYDKTQAKLDVPTIYKTPKPDKPAYPVAPTSPFVIPTYSDVELPYLKWDGQSRHARNLEATLLVRQKRKGRLRFLRHRNLYSRRRKHHNTPKRFRFHPTPHEDIKAYFRERPGVLEGWDYENLSRVEFLNYNLKHDGGFSYNMIHRVREYEDFRLFFKWRKGYVRMLYYIKFLHHKYSTRHGHVAMGIGSTLLLMILTMLLTIFRDMLSTDNILLANSYKNYLHNQHLALYYMSVRRMIEMDLVRWNELYSVTDYFRGNNSGADPMVAYVYDYSNWAEWFKQSTIKGYNIRVPLVGDGPDSYRPREVMPKYRIKMKNLLSKLIKRYGDRATGHLSRFESSIDRLDKMTQISDDNIRADKFLELVGPLTRICDVAMSRDNGLMNDSLLEFHVNRIKQTLRYTYDRLLLPTEAIYKDQPLEPYEWEMRSISSSIYPPSGWGMDPFTSRLFEKYHGIFSKEDYLSAIDQERALLENIRNKLVKLGNSYGMDIPTSRMDVLQEIEDRERYLVNSHREKNNLPTSALALITEDPESLEDYYKYTFAVTGTFGSQSNTTYPFPVSDLSDPCHRLPHAMLESFDIKGISTPLTPLFCHFPYLDNEYYPYANTSIWPDWASPARQYKNRYVRLLHSLSGEKYTRNYYASSNSSKNLIIPRHTVENSKLVRKENVIKAISDLLVKYDACISLILLEQQRVGREQQNINRKRLELHQGRKGTRPKIHSMIDFPINPEDKGDVSFTAIQEITR